MTPAASADPTRFEVRQTEVTYYATLEPPAFQLGGRWVELQSAIYSHLARFELRLADIKVENTTANPGDVSIACWILNYGAVVRYKLDRVEAWSNRAQVAEDTGLITAIVEQGMGVVRNVCPDTHVTGHNVGVAIHGLLKGGAPIAARLAAFVTSQPGGPLAFAPSGVSFLCEFPRGEGRGSVVLEHSNPIRGGAFLKIMSEHPGSLSEVDALKRAIEFFQTSVMSLGLDIVWRS